jgi:biopolymer transport protein ExbB/TolQ
LFIVLNAQAQTNNASFNFILILSGFLVTWLSLIIAILGFFLTLRRDRLAIQDRIDKRTREVLTEVLSSLDFRTVRDERIKEITRDLFHREFQIDVKFIKLDNEISDISDQIKNFETRLLKEIQDTVTAGVATGVAEASRQIAKEKLRDYILPSRE